jgi:hypothetical protein
MPQSPKKLTSKLKVAEVFVPGGLPKYTYVPRAERRLEEKLRQAKENLCKIATVTGATKSGKTVLVKKVFGDAPKVWLDGGHIHTEKDFWEIAGSQLQAALDTEASVEEETSTEVGAQVAGEANVIVAKGSSKVTGKAGRTTTVGRKKELISSTPWKVARVLEASRTPVVIDDFHYIPRELQGTITRVLKPLVFDGLPVVYLAIPHRRYNAVKVEREMNGRIELIEVPTWNEAELTKIAQLGFPILKIDPHFDTSSKLAREAHGSPHLMQEFCRNICYQSDIREVAEPPREINPDFDYTKIFRGVARDLGKNIYEKLARGPRTRTDRLARQLWNGKTADIYKVVLLALAHLKPDVSTIEYETLRSGIRAVLDDELPQAHEVSRVLEQMAKVSSMDESSIPVIDYEKDERRLHITDPFFAFFLRWGAELMD